MEPLNSGTLNSNHDYSDLKRIGRLSKDGVFIYNANTHSFLYVNSSFADIFMEPGDAILSVSGLVLKFIKTEDKHYLAARYNELLQNGCINNTEFRLELPDGKIKHVCCDAYIMDNGDTIAGFVKDYTKTKEHEDFMINYGARKDTLLDMISYNLSGPLNMSRNIIEWTKKVVDDNRTFNVTSQLELLMENTQNSIDVVNEFLREEHQVSARTHVRKTRFDIIERIQATLDKLVEINKDKNFRLISDLTNLNINSDSVKFFQVIHNLLSNAIKFTRADGHIDIKVEEGEADFTISISDDGIGIPEKMHRYIFLQRTLASREGLNGEKSNGLGLYIAKQLVEIIGGTLWFESRENEGSRFFVKLPKD